MASIQTTCPYCKTQNCFFRTLAPPATRVGEKDVGYISFQVPCVCFACGGVIVATFKGYCKSPNDIYNLFNESRDVTNVIDEGSKPNVSLFEVSPKPAQAAHPEHCPENVARAFIEAENTLLAGSYTLAAAGYRKAIERAITPLMPAGSNARMLGHKLGELKKSALLPEAMLEWIKVVKDDGNFALHDEDRDFESAEEVEPTRMFAHTLLQYLFTLPAEVKAAREKIEARK